MKVPLLSAFHECPALFGLLRWKHHLHSSLYSQGGTEGSGCWKVIQQWALWTGTRFSPALLPLGTRTL